MPFSFSNVIKFTAIRIVFWLFCILTFIVIVSTSAIPGVLVSID